MSPTLGWVSATCTAISARNRTTTWWTSTMLSANSADHLLSNLLPKVTWNARSLRNSSKVKMRWDFNQVLESTTWTTETTRVTALEDRWCKINLPGPSQDRPSNNSSPLSHRLSSVSSNLTTKPFRILFRCWMALWVSDSRQDRINHVLETLYLTSLDSQTFSNQQDP